MWLFQVVALVFLFPGFPLGHPFYNGNNNNVEIDDLDDDDEPYQVENESESSGEYDSDEDDYVSDEDEDEDEAEDDDDDDDDDEDEDDDDDEDDGDSDDEDDSDIYSDDDESGRSTDYEDNIDLYVKLKQRLNRVVIHVESEHQGLTLVSTKQYGKSLLIDGHLQCCEKDEFVFHECLVHPALLAHNRPRTVFIMGGGSGSAAREVLKHKDIEKVIICEIDREVVRMCRIHMTANHEAFNDERLQIVYKDAKEALEESDEKFDVIIGDINLPQTVISNELYRITFYENYIREKLKHDGIFVTQAGAAGMFSYKDIFSPIRCTLQRVFRYVIPYRAQVPSFGDLYGWVMASRQPINLNAEELDNRISQRIRGELYYLDGPAIVASTVIDNIMKESLIRDINLNTEYSAALVRGTGLYSPRRFNDE